MMAQVPPWRIPRPMEPRQQRGHRAPTTLLRNGDESCCFSLSVSLSHLDRGGHGLLPLDHTHSHFLSERRWLGCAFSKLG